MDNLEQEDPELAREAILSLVTGRTTLKGFFMKCKSLRHRRFRRRMCGSLKLNKYNWMRHVYQGGGSRRKAKKQWKQALKGIGFPMVTLRGKKYIVVEKPIESDMEEELEGDIVHSDDGSDSDGPPPPRKGGKKHAKESRTAKKQKQETSEEDSSDENGDSVEECEDDEGEESEEESREVEDKTPISKGESRAGSKAGSGRAPSPPPSSRKGAKTHKLRRGREQKGKKRRVEDAHKQLGRVVGLSRRFR